MGRTSIWGGGEEVVLGNEAAWGGHLVCKQFGMEITLRLGGAIKFIAGAEFTCGGCDEYVVDRGTKVAHVDSSHGVVPVVFQGECKSAHGKMCPQTHAHVHALTRVKALFADVN